MEVLPNCEFFYPKVNGTCERQLFKFRFRLRIVTVHSLLFCGSETGEENTIRKTNAVPN